MELEELKEEDLEGEEVKLEIEEKAFESPAFCTKCKKRMCIVETDFQMPGGELTLHITASKCQKCNKELLSAKQAEKMQELLLLISAMKDKSKVKFERAINYDGRSFFIRFPKEITESWSKNMITEIMPITNNELIIHVHKN